MPSYTIGLANSPYRQNVDVPVVIRRQRAGEDAGVTLRGVGCCSPNGRHA